MTDKDLLENAIQTIIALDESTCTTCTEMHEDEDGIKWCEANCKECLTKDCLLFYLENVFPKMYKK